MVAATPRQKQPGKSGHSGLTADILNVPVFPPIKPNTRSSVAYEYYTPANRALAPPVELVVEDRVK
jgi:hypothetical protein